MRTPVKHSGILREPKFLSEAKVLHKYLLRLSEKEIGAIMKIKPDLAHKTKVIIDNWNTDPSYQTMAIDAFLGDIYSGFQAAKLDSSDRLFADKTLLIISGLYGMIRPLDGIMPYRLEMAYRLPDFKIPSLYSFWGDLVAKQIPKNEIIVNLSSVEYSKIITDFVDEKNVITPKFLTHNPNTEVPTFVVVHAKIARGAFASWMIRNRITDIKELRKFKDLGYTFDESLSSSQLPVFVCEDFKGLGLSVRLS